jgi:hypothetical protein
MGWSGVNKLGSVWVFHVILREAYEVSQLGSLEMESCITVNVEYIVAGKPIHIHINHNIAIINIQSNQSD